MVNAEKKVSLLQGTIDYGILHLASAPIAIMAKEGLRTFAGVTGDDPSNTRNAGMSFVVLLSVFAESKLLGRIIVGTVGPCEHYFIDIDREVAEQGWQDIASFCVAHRVPSQYINEDRFVNIPVMHSHKDFTMYRTVVQYGVDSGALGSVTYETPPNFNMAGANPSFLSFSNKIYIHPDSDSYLVFLNYSVSPDYTKTSNASLMLYTLGGVCVSQLSITVPALDCACVRISDILPDGSENFFSFVAVSSGSALLPISIIVNRRLGGVSVEHSHPPQEYLFADWPVVKRIKTEAVNTISGR